MQRCPSCKSVMESEDDYEFDGLTDGPPLGTCDALLPMTRYACDECGNTYQRLADMPYLTGDVDNRPFWQGVL